MGIDSAKTLYKFSHHILSMRILLCTTSMWTQSMTNSTWAISYGTGMVWVGT